MTFRALEALRAVRDLPGRGHPQGDSRVTTEIAMLLVALISRADSSGECWPSYETLGADTKMSRTGVVRWLGRLLELSAAGALPVRVVRTRRDTGSGRSPNLYRIDVPQGPLADRGVVVPQGPLDGTPRSASGPAQGPLADREVVHGRDPIRSPEKAPRRKGRSKKAKKKTPVPPTVADLVTTELVEWAATDHRILQDEDWVRERLESTAFVEHHQGNGAEKVDWLAVAKGWLVKEERWRRERAGEIDDDPGPVLSPMPEGYEEMLREHQRALAEGRPSVLTGSRAATAATPPRRPIKVDPKVAELQRLQAMVPDLMRETGS